MSRQRPSRLSRILVISSTLGVALIAAWVFAPILLSNPLSFTRMLLGGDKDISAAQHQAAPVAIPAATSTAKVETPDPVQVPSTELATASTSAAVADGASTPPVATAPTSASDLANTRTSPWPQDPPAWRPEAPPPQTAAVPPEADTPADAPANPIDMRPASVGPASAPTGTAKVPLPRSRPSRLIAARLAIPLPRPRPEIDADSPTDDQSAFELQVERMR